MLRTKTVRVVLILILLAGVTAILVSYRFRSDQIEIREPEPLLSSNITRQTTRFEYAQMKRGRPVFRVLARTSTQTTEGEHLLEDVQMFRYDVEDKVSDTVEADGAVYKIEKKLIDFKQNVVIRLSDGSTIYADEAEGDLQREEVLIREQFHFVQGDAEGDGRDLDYAISRKLMKIRQGFRLKLSSEAGETRAEAQGGTYDFVRGRVVLRGRAFIGDPQYRMSAEQIGVGLSEERRIRRLTATDGGELALDAGRKFSGQTIKLDLQRKDGRKLLHVQGDGAGGDAVYTEDVPEGRHKLSSDRILAWIESSSPEKPSLEINRLQAGPGVRLTSTLLGIDECRSERLFITFLEDNRGFERINLRGRVKVERQSRIEGALNREVLTAEEVRLLLAPEQQLRAAVAEGSPEVNIIGSRDRRRLTASNEIRLFYKQGRLDRIRAQENSVLESHSEGEDEVLRSKELEAFFSTGVLSGVQASGGVDLSLLNGKGHRHSTSNAVEVGYGNGRVKEIRFDGNVLLKEGVEGSTMELEAEHCRINTLTGVLEAEGIPSRQPVLRTKEASGREEGGFNSETLADRLIIDQTGNRIQARGRVESVVERETSPLVVTAGEMEAELDSGWIHYRSSPRLVQDANLIRGGSIRFNNDTEELVVEDGVESLLVESESAGGRHYEITARHLNYRRNEYHARYEGEVRVTSKELSVNAPVVDLFFQEEEPGDLTQIDAAGGVEINEHGRTWKGRHATYFRLEDRVQVTQ